MNPLPAQAPILSARAAAKEVCARATDSGTCDDNERAAAQRSVLPMGGALDAWNGSATGSACNLLDQYNVTILLGSYLAREAGGHDPGCGWAHMALVAGVHECVD